MKRQSLEQRRIPAAARWKVWYAANRERLIARSIAYSHANRDRVNESRRARKAKAMVVSVPAQEPTQEQIDAAQEQHYAKDRIKSKAWRAAHPEYDVKAKNRAWYERNREKAKATSKAWRAGHLEHAKARDRNYRERNLDRKRAAGRAWAKANPDKRWQGEHARRARLLGAFVERVDRSVVFKRDKGVCGICRSGVKKADTWVVDHVIALARGGTHCYDNVQLAHKRCNELKHTTLPTGQPTLWQVRASS